MDQDLVLVDPPAGNEVEQLHELRPEQPPGPHVELKIPLLAEPPPQLPERNRQGSGTHLLNGRMDCGLGQQRVNASQPGVEPTPRLDMHVSFSSSTPGRSTAC